ncbi:MAG: hypothetical protein AAGI88_23100 [Pseudomonadota bacterium]
MAAGLAEHEFVHGENPKVENAGSEAYRSQALQLAPDDEMVLTMVANKCSPSTVGEESAPCSKDLVFRLTELDPDNGFYWAKLATYQLGNEDTDAALKSYQRAVVAPILSIGWGEQVYRLSKALNEILAITESCAAPIAAGIAAANLPRYEGFINACRAHSGDGGWRQACLDLGHKMETQSPSVVSRMIGFPMQRIVYEAMSDEVGVAAVAERKEQLRETLVEKGSVNECLWSDPDMTEEWLLSLRDFGEIETMSRFAETAADC